MVEMLYDRILNIENWMIEDKMIEDCIIEDKMIEIGVY